MLSEGAGDEWEAHVGAAVGSGAGPLQIVTSAPLDCKKTPMFSIKLHFSLG